MAYTPQVWSDNSGGGTPVSAARLNYMEAGIDTAHDTADAASATATAAQSAANTALTNANTAQTNALAAQTAAANTVAKSLFTAKGSIVVGIGAGAVAELPALADGRLLEPDSTGSKGVKWGRKISYGPSAPAGPRVGDIWLKPVNSSYLNYLDPYTNRMVYRLTSDGATGVTNYTGVQAPINGGSWSPDSKRIVVAKENPADSLQTGIYVFDLTAGKWAALCTCDSHLAYPVFNHDGTEVFFINGANGTPNGSGNKPWQLRKVTVPTNLDFDQVGPSNASTLVRDIRADAEAASKNLVSVTQLARNNDGGNTSWRMWSVQAQSSDGFRTLIYQPSGSIPYTGASGWSFAMTATSVENFSVWSADPTDGVFRIGAYRGTTRGIWSTSSTAARLWDFQTSNGAITIADTHWAYHAATGTEVWMGPNRDVWYWPNSGGDVVESSRGPTASGIQIFISPANPPATNLGLTRFIAAETGSGSGSEPYLYRATLQDFNVGGTSPYSTGAIWASQIRPNKRWVGHRNKNTLAANATLKKYMPNAQISPDGNWVMWQSTSETSIVSGTTTYTYPSETCGPPGGNSSTVAFLDIYMAPMS